QGDTQPRTVRTGRSGLSVAYRGRHPAPRPERPERPEPIRAHAFAVPPPGYPVGVTQQTSQQELYRFLEDRFACAQACTECASGCALRAGALDHSDAELERVRGMGIMCAEVCDATCRTLTEEGGQDEAGLHIQLEWCRTICLECALAFDSHPATEKGA